MVRVLAFVVMFLSALGATGSSAAASSARAPLATTYDCARHADLVLPPEGLRLALEDATSAPSKHKLEKLGRLACEGAAASVRVAADENRDITWITGLPVTLVDAIDGMADQAHFARDLGMNPPRRVKVAAGLLSRQLERQFLFIFGHELGHGVYAHDEQKRKVRGTAAVAGLLGSSILFGVAKGPVLKVAAAGIALKTAEVVACKPGRMNVKFEKQSDVFGVKVLVETGLPLMDAKAEAIALMNSHTEQESGCIVRPNGTYGLPDNNRHPATADRIAAIEAI